MDACADGIVDAWQCGNKFNINHDTTLYWTNSIKGAPGASVPHLVLFAIMIGDLMADDKMYVKSVLINFNVRLNTYKITF